MPTSKKANKSSDDDVLQPPLDSEQEPVAPPTPTAILLHRSAAVSRTVQTMRNGAHSLLPGSTHPFSPHPGFMLLIIKAYERNDPEEFLKQVERYLDQAVLHVPQAGRREDIPETIAGLRELIAIPNVGFAAVARHLLSFIGAPL